jgi:hypothetical protein
MRDRDRTFEPDYGIDGPYDGGPWSIGDFALRWSRRGVLIAIAAFALGFIGRRYGFF